MIAIGLLIIVLLAGSVCVVRSKRKEKRLINGHEWHKATVAKKGPREAIETDIWKAGGMAPQKIWDLNAPPLQLAPGQAEEPDSPGPYHECFRKVAEELQQKNIRVEISADHTCNRWDVNVRGGVGVQNWMWHGQLDFEEKERNEHAMMGQIGDF